MGGASLWACSLAAAWSSCASGGARSSSGTSLSRSTWPSAGRRRRSSKHASNEPGIVGLRALPWLPLLDQALRLALAPRTPRTPRPPGSSTLLRRHFEPGLPPTSSIGIHGVRLPQARRVAYVGLSHGFPHALPRLVPPVRRGQLRTAQHMSVLVCVPRTPCREFAPCTPRQ